MWVYDDRVRQRDAGTIAASVIAAVGAAAALPAGLGRHGRLAEAFLGAAALAQGVADRDFESVGRDRRTPSRENADRLVHALARALVRSWESGFAAPPPDGEPIRRLAEAVTVSAPLAVRQAEGFALYAVYPEAYADAARRSGLGPETVVIGLRTIGGALAAVVAAGLGAAPAITLRPTGEPFRRRIAAAPELAADLRALRSRPFAVVDEGPGLSGSSFAAAVAFLEACGVERVRIHLFPSHAGSPGSAADEGIRRMWDVLPRHVAAGDAVFAALPGWIEALTGPLDGPPAELSGGAWRARVCDGEADWPPVHPWLERRKILLSAGGRRFLARFAGLGEEGEAKLAVARTLAGHGLAPEPVGLVHGFLVERWIEGRLLPPGPLDRRRLGEIGRYIGLRARTLAVAEPGADVATLARMARHNAALALGEAAARSLDGLAATAERLAGRVAPVRIDGRLHRWEWRIEEDGRLLKTDALDHATGHDLVGCQDVAWDVAGAAAEFDMDAAAVEALAAAVEAAAGRAVDRELVAFMVPCYDAFQLGLWTMASEADPDGGRPAREAARHADRLARWVTR